jgi:hypothetical protein
MLLTGAKFSPSIRTRHSHFRVFEQKLCGTSEIFIEVARNYLILMITQVARSDSLGASRPPSSGSRT